MAAKIQYRHLGDAYTICPHGGAVTGLVTPYLHEDRKLFWGVLMNNYNLMYSRDFERLLANLGDGQTCEVDLLCHCKEVYSGDRPIGIVVKLNINDYRFYRIEEHKVLYTIHAESFKELSKQILSR